MCSEGEGDKEEKECEEKSKKEKIGKSKGNLDISSFRQYE
jgi:hypothetical protein